MQWNFPPVFQIISCLDSLMKILRSIDELSSLNGPIVLAAGTFDGLHLGHQALIRRAQEEASHVGGTAVVMTFDRHPASVVRPESAPKLLTPNTSKLAILEQMGVPVVLLLEFNESLSSISAGDFIRSITTASKPLNMICVGSQWSFGKGGEGNITLLKILGQELGFFVAGIDPVEIAGSPISSTRIRNAIACGNFQEAKNCLGRSFLLTGRVVTGAGLGTKIGFPTANLQVEGMQLPPDGVYAVRIQEGDKRHVGVANIGIRPTVDPSSSQRTVEVHLFDFSESLVGRELGIEFIEFLRSERKFPDLSALTTQIAGDCETARSLT